MLKIKFYKAIETFFEKFTSSLWLLKENSPYFCTKCTDPIKLD